MPANGSRLRWLSGSWSHHTPGRVGRPVHSLARRARAGPRRADPVPVISLDLRALLADALELVLPAPCAACRRVDGEGALCRRCAQALADPPRHHRPVPCPPGLPGVWVTAGYEGAAREAIVAHKERGRRALASPLGRALARAAEAALLGMPPGGAVTPIALVPVPSSRRSRRERGDDPLLRITRCAARSLRERGVPATAAPLLCLVRETRDQAGLAASERHANLRGAMTARRVPAGARLVIVDDVVTTGATLAEAVRALGPHGRVAVAAIAATRLRRLG